MASSGDEPEVTPEADQSEGATASTRSGQRCLGCDGLPIWESLVDNWGERWLAVCACGRIDAFFPDRRHPEQQPTDPLTLFLQGHIGPRRPITPPWVRLFLQSVQEPTLSHWRHSPDPCEDCGARTIFGILAWPRAATAGLCMVCLNCGATAATYSEAGTSRSEPTLFGRAWTPPCPAVKRLRECVHAAGRSQLATDAEPLET
jgi:hypothetical protein